MTKPSYLLIAFALVSSLLLYLRIDTNFGVLTDWIENITFEMGFICNTALIFWICLRSASATWKEKTICWSCLVGSVQAEVIAQPWRMESEPYRQWSMVYRYFLFWLFFTMWSKGLGLSIQKPNQAIPTGRLTMLTLMVSTALFAIVFLRDVSLRQWVLRGSLQGENLEPPLLALVAASSRSMLWIACALMSAENVGRSKANGVALLLLWAICRAGVVAYLIAIYFPTFQMAGMGFKRPPSVLDMTIRQFMQLFFVASIAWIISCLDYRFYVQTNAPKLDVAESTRFEDIQ
jgi:hypothetical protein